MSAIDKVVEANRRYAEGLSQGGLPGRPPSLRLAVVTCLDCRVHVSKLLDLGLGAAHIIRNAGGIVTEDVPNSWRAQPRPSDHNAPTLPELTGFAQV